MERGDINKFFEALGEIWRDVTAIEFLMRCALAQRVGDIHTFPSPPYQKGKVYEEYPASFANPSFGEVAKEFNQHFPELAIPQELVDLRHAMAHGIIAEVNGTGFDELIKFKHQKNVGLATEFALPLEQSRLNQIRQSLKEYRRYIAKVAEDKTD